MNDSVPTLDLRRWETDRSAFIADLGAAYSHFGFCGISHHGIPDEVIDRAYGVFKAFFAMPLESKKRYHVEGSGGARGYTGFGVEVAKDSEHPDLKEFWHVGRELPAGHRHADIMPANLWVEEVPRISGTRLSSVRGVGQPRPHYSASYG